MPVRIVPCCHYENTSCSMPGWLLQLPLLRQWTHRNRPGPGATAPDRQARDIR